MNRLVGRSSADHRYLQAMPTAKALTQAILQRCRRALASQYARPARAARGIVGPLGLQARGVARQAESSNHNERVTHASVGAISGARSVYDGQYARPARDARASAGTLALLPRAMRLVARGSAGGRGFGHGPWGLSCRALLPWRRRLGPTLRVAAANSAECGRLHIPRVWRGPARPNGCHGDLSLWNSHVGRARGGLFLDGPRGTGVWGWFSCAELERWRYVFVVVPSWAGEGWACPAGQAGHAHLGRRSLDLLSCTSRAKSCEVKTVA